MQEHVPRSQIALTGRREDAISGVTTTPQTRLQSAKTSFTGTPPSPARSAGLHISLRLEGWIVYVCAASSQEFLLSLIFSPSHDTCYERYTVVTAIGNEWSLRA